jgi:hypothetical protein
MDGAYLVSLDDFDEPPPGTCPACDGLSPGISVDGETIMHCTLCGDSGKVTIEQEKQWEEDMRTKYAGRKGFSG